MFPSFLMIENTLKISSHIFLSTESLCCDIDRFLAAGKHLISIWGVSALGFSGSALRNCHLTSDIPQFITGFDLLESSFFKFYLIQLGGNYISSIHFLDVIVSQCTFRYIISVYRLGLVKLIFPKFCLIWLAETMSGKFGRSMSHESKVAGSICVHFFANKTWREKNGIETLLRVAEARFGEK